MNDFNNDNVLLINRQRYYCQILCNFMNLLHNKVIDKFIYHNIAVNIFTL